MDSRFPALRSFAAAGLMVTALGTAAAALDCKNPMNTPEINECAAIEQKAVEAKLNQAYQRTLKALEDEGKESIETKTKLIAAQRAWIKFREADCDAVYQRNAGGTIRTVMYIDCMQAHAKERIKMLEDFAQAY